MRAFKSRRIDTHTWYQELGSDTHIESEHFIHAHKAWGFTESERVVYFRKDLD